MKLLANPIYIYTHTYTHTHTHTHNGILFIYHKNIEILSFLTTWMDLEDIMLSEVSRINQRKTNTV